MAQPQGPSNAEQFKQSFREEAREILTELESALLALNENPKDTELVSRIFRGLHTIKGSGAMSLREAGLFYPQPGDRFRRGPHGRLQISAELIDLTLAALDQIRALLEEGAAGAAPVDPAACAPSSRASASCRIEERDMREEGRAKKDAAKKTQPARVAVSAAAGHRELHIRFVPGRT